jgi:hypothetical protein
MAEQTPNHTTATASPFGLQDISDTIVAPSPRVEASIRPYRYNSCNPRPPPPPQCERHSSYSYPAQQFAEETPADDQCEETFDNEHSEGNLSLRTDLDVKSCEWKFSGDYQLTSLLAYRLQTIEMHFREDHLLKTPVRVDYMIIYMNIQTDNTYSIRGYVQGRCAKLSEWKAWLDPQKISWTPVSDIAFDDEYLADDKIANAANSAWRVMVTHGRLKAFQAGGRAFRFETSVDINIPSHASHASEHLEIVKEEFIAKVRSYDGKGIKAMSVMCDARLLATAVPGNVTVNIKGFLQCNQSDISKWHKWCDARWTLMRGGLWGNEDFQLATSPSSEWLEFFTVGKLTKNNAGRKATVAQASRRRRLISWLHFLPYHAARKSIYPS